MRTILHYRRIPTGRGVEEEERQQHGGETVIIIEEITPAEEDFRSIQGVGVDFYPRLLVFSGSGRRRCSMDASHGYALFWGGKRERAT